jgi:hypothetical protein
LSGCSNPATYSSTAPSYSNPTPGTPGAPYLVNTSASGPESGVLTIGWAGVQGAASYNVIHQGTGTVQTVYGTQATISGLYAGGTYTCAIQAVSSAGVAGQVGPYASFTVAPYTPPAPGQAGALYCAGTGISGSSAYITFAWGAVNNATEYQIVNAVTGAVVWSGSGQQATLTGLYPGGVAHYALKAGNSSGWGSQGQTYTVSNAGYSC